MLTTTERPLTPRVGILGLPQNGPVGHYLPEWKQLSNLESKDTHKEQRAQNHDGHLSFAQ